MTLELDSPSPGEVWNVLITENWAPDEATPCLIVAVLQMHERLYPANANDKVDWECLMCVAATGKLVNEEVMLSYDRRLTRRSEL